MSNDLIDDERPRGWWSDVLRTWLPAILAVLLIRTYVFEPFRIPSGSMVPTLLIGDHVVVNKAAYGLWAPWIVVEIPFMENFGIVPSRFELLNWADPKRGDIVVFRYPKDESLHYIKRVVGLAGDKIRVKDNRIFINGVEQAWEYQGAYDFIDDGCSTEETKRFVERLDGVSHTILTNLGAAGGLGTYPQNRLGDEVTVPEDSVFVMGDNRDNSEDGRKWGFVRFDQIKGKAHFVWFSWDSCAEKIRADRFFRSLYKIYDD